MSSQKLVRATIARPGASASSVRYVPLEIFGLWEALMTSRHGFEVRDTQASLWIDVDEAQEPRYEGRGQFERVSEVTVYRYSERDGMFARIVRYLPETDLPTVRPVLLGHYREDAQESAQPQVREKPGVWILREDVTAA